MLTAVVLFTHSAEVRFRCEQLGLDAGRVLHAETPFAAWNAAYAAAGDSARALLDLGVEMGQWLNGEEGWLDAIVANVVPPVVLEIQVAQLRALELTILAVPWELLALVDPSDSGRLRARPARVHRDVVPESMAAAVGLAARHLALDPGVQLGPVRRLAAATTPRPPSPFRPTVVFMAAQPDGFEGLDVDREEVAIVSAAGGVAIDLHVEDSGTLDRLGDLIARVEACDVVHLSCHGTASPGPRLLLEDAHGCRDEVNADRLAQRLPGVPPSLLFLSACASAGSGNAGWSFAVDLCRRGWPAVLGWASRVTDDGAIRFAAELYRRIAHRERLVDAVAASRITIASTTEWHLVRLVLGPEGGGRLVDGIERRAVATPWSSDFLDAERRIPVLEPASRFGYRRAFQRVIAALARDRAGAMIHGATDLERATFAQRICRRLPALRRVVVTRADAADVLEGIRASALSGDVDAIVQPISGAVIKPNDLARAMRALLEGPCERAEHGAILLVVHGIVARDRLEPGDSGDPRALLRELVDAFSGAATESRLLLTGPHRFAERDGRDDDLVARLVCEDLGPLPTPPAAALVALPPPPPELARIANGRDPRGLSRRAVVSAAGAAAMVGALMHVAGRRRSGQRIRIGFSHSNADTIERYVDRVRARVLPGHATLRDVDLDYEVLSNADARSALFEPAQGFDLVTVDEPWFLDRCDRLADLEMLLDRAVDPNLHVPGLHAACTRPDDGRLVALPWRTNVIVQITRLDRLQTAHASCPRSQLQVPTTFAEYRANLDELIACGLSCPSEFYNEVNNAQAEAFLALYRLAAGAPEQYGADAPIVLAAEVARKVQAAIVAWRNPCTLQRGNQMVASLLGEALDHGPVVGNAWAGWLSPAAGGDRLRRMLERGELDVRGHDHAVSGAWSLAVPAQRAGVRARIAAELAYVLSTDREAQRLLWGVDLLPAIASLWAATDAAMPKWVDWTYRSAGRTLGDAVAGARRRLRTRRWEDKQRALNNFVTRGEVDRSLLVLS